MDLRKARILLIVGTSILALFVASPAIQRLIAAPQSEFYTELWLLDSNHTVENYPSNLVRNNNYTVFLGIRNHLSYCGYYVVEVKFRNATLPDPNAFIHNPNDVKSIYNITLIVPDKGDWEMPVTFSFDYSFNPSLRQVNFNHLILDDVTLDLRAYASTWDSQYNGFYGNLFFELWLYNSTAGDFQYNNRYVSLPMNMTA